MELHKESPKLPIENSKASLDRGYGDQRTIHDPFMGSQPLFSEGNGAFSTKIPRSPADTKDEFSRHQELLKKLLKGKEKEWASIGATRIGPLRLLDLPVDVLKEIIKEVWRTHPQIIPVHPLNRASGYPHQRLSCSGADKLCATQLSHTSYICTL